MKAPATSSRPMFGFRMPTAENLIPIRLDIELESQRVKDNLTWDANARDSEIIPFANNLVKDMKVSPAFAQHIAQSMQSQLNDFRSLEGQQLSTEEKVLVLKLDIRVKKYVIRDQILWDVGDFDSDPEGFARGLCKDLGIEDPEVAPAIAFAIREQLYELAKQNVTSGRETRITKKQRKERGIEFNQASHGTTALSWMKRSNNKTSVTRKKTECDAFEPVVEILTEEETETLDAKENARLKKRLEDKEDSFASRYVRT